MWGPGSSVASVLPGARRQHDIGAYSYLLFGTGLFGLFWINGCLNDCCCCCCSSPYRQLSLITLPHNAVAEWSTCICYSNSESRPSLQDLPDTAIRWVKLFIDCRCQTQYRF